MYASLMNLCWIWKCHSSQGMIREKYHLEVIFKWLCTWISSSLKIQKGNNINNNDSNSTSPCLYWLREEISPISKLDIYFWGASECVGKVPPISGELSCGPTSRQCCFCPTLGYSSGPAPPGSEPQKPRQERLVVNFLLTYGYISVWKNNIVFV